MPMWGPQIVVYGQRSKQGTNPKKQVLLQMTAYSRPSAVHDAEAQIQADRRAQWRKAWCEAQICSAQATPYSPGIGLKSNRRFA
jgi:hypothetical protein